MLDKSNIAFICILGMMVGFLCAPALLSIAMMVYGVNGLRGISPRKWLKDKWWLAGIAWIAFYAISYFWSADKESWSVAVQVKLPFLLLPLAFAYTPRFSARQLQALILCVGIILLGGVEYSISFLIRQHDEYLVGYKVSHILPTPSRNDHISFSIGITLYIIWAIYSWPQIVSKAIRWYLGVILLLLAVFLHILAAKSGLVCFYVFFISWSIYLAFSRRKLLGFIAICAIPTFYFLAMRYIPTFNERKQYMDYSMQMLRQGDRTGNYGDIGRLMSYKLAMYLIRKHPVTGVGAGDLLDEMKKGYDEFYPQVEDRDRLVPHNQFMIVAVSVGVPAMVVFAIWFLMPLTWLRKNRQSFFFLVTWVVVLIHLLIDTALEVQMGVFLCVFFLLIMREELPQFAERKKQYLPA